MLNYNFIACGSDQYDCEDLTCIDSELRCNQVDNCRFRWDEDGCPVCFTYKLCICKDIIVELF